MIQPSMLPLLAWDHIAHDAADDRLRIWEHFIGECNRPFGRQSFRCVATATPNAPATS